MKSPVEYRYLLELTCSNCNQIKKLLQIKKGDRTRHVWRHSRKPEFVCYHVFDNPIALES